MVLGHEVAREGWGPGCGPGSGDGPARARARSAPGRRTRWISAMKPKRFRQVLEDVAGDDEVLTGVCDGTEPIGVEVDLHVRLCRVRSHLGEEVATFFGRPPVHERDRRPPAGGARRDDVRARPRCPIPRCGCTNSLRGEIRWRAIAPTRSGATCHRPLITIDGDRDRETTTFGALGRTRTCATGSGGRCSIR